MTKLPRLRPFAPRRNDRSFSNGGRRLAAWTAAIGAVALVGGILQTASATSLSQELVKGTTTTDISSSSTQDATTIQYESVVGEGVTYTAKVTEATPPVPDTEQALTGLVDFEDVSGDAPVVLCENVPLDDPNDASDDPTEAECTVSPVYSDPATHTIRAIYEGNDDYNGSEDSLTQVVNKADTTVDVASSTNPSVSGQAVVYTATISVVAPGEATPSGTVDFFEDNANGDPQPIPECADRELSLNSATGKYEATCSPTTATYLSAGTHAISAAYDGNDDLNGSAGPEPPLTQEIKKAKTATGVSGPNSPKTGQNITLTAVVLAQAPGTGTPTGSVVFKEGGNAAPCLNGNTKTLTSSGSATCVVTYNTAGPRTITAEYLGDSNFEVSTSPNYVLNVTLPYVVNASVNSSSDPTNAAFRISNGPARDYTLCVKYLRYDADTVWLPRTPPPKTGSTKWTINLNDKCKNFSWRRGASSTKSMSSFGFAAKGIYQATWRLGGRTGPVIGTDTMNWTTWCPPSAMRNIGTWRPSRHKALDWCQTSSGYVGKGGSRSSLDADLGWRWMSGLGRLHVEYVAMDSGWYSNPTTGRTALLRAPGGSGTNNRWTLVGKYVCDTYHGWKEFHRVYMAQQGNAVFITGGQYSTRTPSVSGTWSAHKC